MVESQGDLQLFTKKEHFDRVEVMNKSGSFIWELHQDFLNCSVNFFKLLQISDVPRGLKCEKQLFFSSIASEDRSFLLDVMHDCMVNEEEFEVNFRLYRDPSVKMKLLGYPMGPLSAKVLVANILMLSEIRDTSNMVILGQDQERKRISRELHDSVGQKLISLKYTLQLAQLENSMDRIDQVNDSLNEVIEEIRTISHNLSSQVVTEFGLEAAINGLLSEAAKILGAGSTLNYDLPSEGEENSPNEQSSVMIYRIIQEALTNAIKHSKATKLLVTMETVNQQYFIEIVDNGVGISDINSVKKGLGLQNIKERVLFMNGFVKFISQTGKGLQIKIKLPYGSVVTHKSDDR